MTEFYRVPNIKQLMGEALAKISVLSCTDEGDIIPYQKANITYYGKPEEPEDLV